LFVASGVLTLSAATLSAQAAQAAQVTCKDGTKAAAGRGACSGHGGMTVAAKTEAKAEAKVAKTEAKADVKAEKTEAKAETKVAKHHKAKAKKAKA